MTRHAKKSLLSLSVIGLLLAAEAAYSFAAAHDIRLLFFYRQHCKWCRMMDDVLDDPAIRQILQENVQTMKIDVYGRERTGTDGATGAELAKKYNVFGVPTLIFLGARQEELLRVPGVLTKEDFRDLLCEYVAAGSGFCRK